MKKLLIILAFTLFHFICNSQDLKRFKVVSMTLSDRNTTTTPVCIDTTFYIFRYAMDFYFLKNSIFEVSKIHTYTKFKNLVVNNGSLIHFFGTQIIIYNEKI